MFSEFVYVPRYVKRRKGTEAMASQTLVYMHSFYSDIGAINPMSLLNYQVMDNVLREQKNRDAALLFWLNLNNVRAFPMPQEEFAQIMHLFQFATEHNHMLYLMFSWIDGNGMDKGCLVLKGGKAEVHPSRLVALKEMSAGSKHTAIVNTPVYYNKIESNPVVM